MTPDSASSDRLGIGHSASDRLESDHDERRIGC